MPPYQIGFVMEQALGHITHTKNLEQALVDHPAIQPRWAPISFEPSGIGARIPVFKSNWTVRAGLRARQALAHLARSGPLDGLFFHTQVPAVLASDWLRRLPGIVSLDATPLQYDQLGDSYNHARGPVWLEVQKWRLNRDCFRAAKRIVAWSAWAKQGLVADYEVPEEKVVVIPPGVHVATWAMPTPRQRSEAPPKILFVGGDFARKGGDLLLEAFRSLRPLGVELHVATRSQLSPEPGLFVYNSMQPNSPELRALYQQCEIFALPTAGDCLPMVLSEAGAAGMAVVSTRLAGIPEIVRNEETGLVVPIGDVAALTEALRRLVLQPSLRLELGERAISHVARHYDAAANAAQLSDLLVEVVRRHPARREVAA